MNFMLTPGVCWSVFVIFIITYLIYLGINGAFKGKEIKYNVINTEEEEEEKITKLSGFMHFGPDDIEFFNMKIDTLYKVNINLCNWFF